MKTKKKKNIFTILGRLVLLLSCLMGLQATRLKRPLHIFMHYFHVSFWILPVLGIVIRFSCLAS